MVSVALALAFVPAVGVARATPDSAALARTPDLAPRAAIVGVAATAAGTQAGPSADQLPIVRATIGAGAATTSGPSASGTAVAAPSTVTGLRTGLGRAGRWRTPAGRVRRLVLVGDSLAQEVTPFVQFLTPGKAFVPKFWGGTAPCDWRDVDLEADRNTVVVITFTGNSLTECMRGPDGEHLADQALVERYRADLGTIIDAARSAGARVVLIGQPHRAPSFEAEVEIDGINVVAREYAQAFKFVSYVDAGRAVEDADGSYAERLPCTPYDADCAPDGTTVVRGDGVHFCPIAGENPCPVWSSGAFRFGLAIASGANDPRSYD